MEAPPEIPKSDPLPLLSIFHFVLAGFSGLGVLMGIFYAFFAKIFMGGITSAVTNGGGTINGQNVEEMSQQQIDDALVMFDTMGSLFTVIGIFIAVISLIFAVLLIVAGLKLRQPTGHTFCMVVAGASCLLFPFGTALGIFTLINLSKPEVKTRFGS